LISSRQESLNRVASFLGVDAGKLHAYENVHENISIGGYKQHPRFDAPTVSMRLIQRHIPFLRKRITDNSNRLFSQKPTLEPRFQEMITRMLTLKIGALQQLMDKDLSGWMQVEA